jgi:CHAT domain-containing protein/tetratricopeptide (TPR) repeat protein
MKWSRHIVASMLIIMIMWTRNVTESAQSADTYWQKAETYRKQGKFLEAAKFYENSANAEQKNRTSRLLHVITAFHWAGFCYQQVGQYDQALTFYQQSLTLAQKLERDVEICANLNNIGMLYQAWGQYDTALEYFSQALGLNRKLNREADIAMNLSNIGTLYKDWGQYDTALEYSSQALSINRKLNQKSCIATDLNNIGSIYKDWGQYDMALKYYTQALNLDRTLALEANIARDINHIGTVYLDWGQYDAALEYFSQALSINRKLNREAEVITGLRNIGLLYAAWEQYDIALEYFSQALALDRKLNREADIAEDIRQIGVFYAAWEQYDIALEYFSQALALDRKLTRDACIARDINSLGDVYKTRRQYDTALKHYQQALEISRKLGREADMAMNLNNIGTVYYTLKKYTGAIPYFLESVTLKEQLRKTAQGDVRREYFATQIFTYQYLSSCYLQIGNAAKFFEVIELSRAKRLTEQLAGSEEFSPPSLEDIQQNLPEDTALLIYADSVNDTLAQMCITKDDIAVSEYPTNTFIQMVMPPEQMERLEISEISRDSTGTSQHHKNAALSERQAPTTFKTLIEYYRVQLLNLSTHSRRTLSPQYTSEIGELQQYVSGPHLSRHLYSFLIGPFQKYLHGKSKLIIIPDGILNFLPFETLIDDQGNYLVEGYHITYAQSLGVLELIKKRQYSQNRKPLLAFGGAVYEGQKYEEEMFEHKTTLTSLQKQVDILLRRKSSLQPIYAQLGRGGWENLPATLDEVKAIQTIVTGVDLLTGKNVNEITVKHLSDIGELADYKVIHFATHGDANPYIPELSALVLSQVEEGEEDGYLRTGEIMKLNLKADFVNLSACETGLGKLYSGEGVVGLTQSFLIAGANGLSVSLWQVADESTALFMTALYSSVETQGLSYAEAMTTVKRHFINGDFGEAWKAPYFWAPFVYYGSEGVLKNIPIDKR